MDYVYSAIRIFIHFIISHQQFPLELFSKRNRIITGLIFMAFDWLRQMINQLNLRKINPFLISLLFENLINIVGGVGKVSFLFF